MDCSVDGPDDTHVTGEGASDNNHIGASRGKQPFDSGPLADAGERRAIFNVLDSYR